MLKNERTPASPFGVGNIIRSIRADLDKAEEEANRLPLSYRRTVVLRGIRQAIDICWHLKLDLEGVGGK